VSAKPSKREKRWRERRQADERRTAIRWEPEKSARRGSDGRRRNDHWNLNKKK
jgi:hypothetical protein